jgi:hypothetical protein
MSCNDFGQPIARIELVFGLVLKLSTKHKPLQCNVTGTLRNIKLIIIELGRLNRSRKCFVSGI